MIRNIYPTAMVGPEGLVPLARQFDFYVITWKPKDFPGLFVVRRWHGIDVDMRPTDEHQTAETLEEARAHVPAGYDKRIGRTRQDDPVIVETWA